MRVVWPIVWLDRLVVAWLFTEKSTAYRISKLGKTSSKTKNVVTAPWRRFLNKLRILVIKCTKKRMCFYRNQNLNPILLMVLIKVRLWFLLMRQGENKCIIDSLPIPQLQIGSNESWKLVLGLYSCKWLDPRHYRVSKLITIGS